MRIVQPNRPAANAATRAIFMPPFFRGLLLLVLTGVSLGARAGFVEDWARMKLVVPEGYVCHRATGPITVDGKMNEPSWQAAPWTRDFRDIEDAAKPQPRYRTRAKMLWDDQYFYVAAELEEPNVWGAITQHDAVIFQDDDFEVFIDPDGDTHDYYEFEMNALNTGWDLLLKKPYKDGGPALNEWEIPGLKTAVHVNGTINNPNDRDVGWSVEIAFPWKVLGEYAKHQHAPPLEGDQWRVDFSRVEWEIQIVNGKYQKVAGKREDNWIWSPPGIVDMHRPEKWGYVQFTAMPAGSVRFQPDPSAAARDELQGIYYRQKDFQKATGHWAASFQELGGPVPADSGSFTAPKMKPTPEGFEATTELKLPNGKILRWHIRQDALIWAD